MTTVFLIISFYLENYFGLILNINIMPLFFLITLILLCPYFKQKNKYLIITFIAGIIYDIVFTNLLYIDALLFPLIGLLTLVFNKNFNSNLFSNILFAIISLTIYQLLFYLFFIMIGHNDFKTVLLFKSLLYTYMTNIVYCIICYFLVNKLCSKRME